MGTMAVIIQRVDERVWYLVYYVCTVVDMSIKHFIGFWEDAIPYPVLFNLLSSRVCLVKLKVRELSLFKCLKTFS